ncbi:hypothetical protein GBAR_LOCUS29086 [Geodia barretti]|uniref:Uncharacterized protein n=1 Tax=Geodia barretti TaxID=519541 RepID=A0AA35TU93_GEOBA|nr:hypothetical protein GBAR_LOCUS29086 [Geodia barretti]
MEVEDCQLTPQDLGERGRKDGSLDCGEREGGGEEGSGEVEEAADVASSTEAADDVIIFRGRRKRRTNILDDSDSDAENDSNSSHTNDAKNSKRVAEDVLGESKGESQSLFARALAAVGGGKRTKRKSFQPLSVRTVSSGRAHSGGHPQTVVDLTEETMAEKTGLGQQEEEEEEKDGEGEEGEEKVSCPLCRKLFLCSLIEAHAAGCGEPNEAGTEQSRDVQRRRVSPHLALRQSSLLTPRFSKAQPVVSLPPSSSDSLEISFSSTAPDRDSQEDNGVRMTTDGPRVVECEGGGYQVDPTTISSSPIRSVHRHTYTQTHTFDHTGHFVESLSWILRREPTTTTSSTTGGREVVRDRRDRGGHLV